MKLASWVGGLVGVGLLLGASGCGKKASEAVTEKLMERAIEKEYGGKAKADLSEGKISIQTEQGQMTMSTGDSVAVPKEFPEDVFVYSGAKVLSAVTVPDGSVLMLQTSDSPAKVIAAYQEKMKDKGWEQAMAMDMGEQKHLAFQKDGRAVTIMAGSDGDVTSISLSVGKQ